MFHPQDPRYETLLVRSIGSHFLDRCVQQALLLGARTTFVSSRCAVEVSAPDLRKHAVSCSQTAILRHCRQQLELQRKQLSRSMEPPPVSGDAAIRAQRQQVLGRLREEVVAADEPPSVKLSSIQAMVAEAVANSAPDWQHVGSLLAVAAALCRLEFGDFAEQVAHVEMDLALVYCVLRNFEMACHHCETCIAVLKSLTAGMPNSSFTENCRWIEAKNSLIFAAARSVGRSPRGIRKLLCRAAPLLDSTQPSFEWLFVKLCCAVAANNQSEEHHQDVLDAVDAAVGCATFPEAALWAHCAAMTLHLPVLQSADEALRGLGIPSAKEQLAAEVTKAASKKELAAVGERLRETLAALSAKSNSLQLCIVRQVDHLNNHFAAMFSSLSRFHGIQLSPGTSAAVSLLRYTWFRCLAVGLRRKDCDTLSAAVVDGLTSTFGARHRVVACSFIDVGCALAEQDISRLSDMLPARMLHANFDNSSVERPEAGEDPLGPFSATACMDSVDSDDDEAHDYFLRRSVKYFTRGTQMLLADGQSAYAMWSVLSLSLRQLTLLLHRQCDTKSELRWLSVLAALSAEVLGPSHPEAAAALSLAAEKHHAGRVHAPLFSPSWGVQQLLTNVVISCDTEGADVFYSISDERAKDVSCAFVRYTAPIQLDRAGRVFLRAYGVKDGTHSGVVDAKFTVVHRSE